MLWVTGCSESIKKRKNKINWWVFSKKKEPLVLPPDFSEIPEPGTLKNKKTEEDENRIKKILKTTNKSSSNDKKKSSTEKSIIDKIRQWKIRT